jgi:hypothetical protein
MKRKNLLVTVSVFLLLILFIVYKTKNNTSFDNLIKKHIISVDLGIKLQSEFEKNRINLIEPTLLNKYKDSVFEDTKFVWFSLEDVKQYLKFIEKIQKENPKKEVSGIRIYFAAYPNNQSFKHPGQQTFFMATTVNSGANNLEYTILNHFPFYIESNTQNPLKGDFIIIEDLMLGSNETKKRRINAYNGRNKFKKAGFHQTKNKSFSA